MQIRCSNCGGSVTIADTGAVPAACPHCQQRPTPPSLGRFRIERLLAAGGMGEVYLGAHEELATRVALKLLPVTAGQDAASLRERFRREAKLAAAIDHPGVVHVLDLAEDRGRLFLVLELVDGVSLRSRLRSGRLLPAEAVRIAAATADVLGAAHRHGVVHRDIKPENVMLARDGAVRVLDFGIARALADSEPLTRTGELLGTPEYMAPEQLLEAPSAIDQRTDVHALAVLTYELLTRRSPFAGQSVFQALKLVESLMPPPPSQLVAGVPAAVDAVVMQGLAKDPQQRPADGDAFALALRAAWPAADQEGHNPRAATAVRVLLPLLLVLAAGLGFAIGKGRDPAPAPAPAAAPPDALPEGAAEPQDGAALLQRGRQRLHRGLVHGALTDLDRAARKGAPAAAPLAAAAWHCVHTLLPLAVSAPPWLSLCDRARRDRLFGLGHEDAAATDPLLLACRDLADADGRGAWQRLQALPPEQWTAAHAVIALLAARLVCVEPATLAQVRERLRARFPGPLLALAAAATTTEARQQLEQLAAEAPATSADRWLFLLLAAAEPADERGRDRLRATAELAWLTGADALAPIWLGGLRAAAAARGVPLERDEAQRLQRLLAGFSPAEHPALLAVQSQLDLLAGDATAARRRLVDAALPPAPQLALLHFWRAAEPASLDLLADVLRGVAMAEVTLPPATDAALATAHALAAWCDAGDGDAARSRRGEHWRQALRHDAAFAVLPALRPSAAHGESLTELLAAVQQLAAAPPTAAAIAALRLCAAAGLDFTALPAEWRKEVTGGIE